MAVARDASWSGSSMKKHPVKIPPMAPGSKRTEPPRTSRTRRVVGSSHGSASRKRPSLMMNCTKRTSR